MAIYALGQGPGLPKAPLVLGCLLLMTPCCRLYRPDNHNAIVPMSRPTAAYKSKVE